MRNVFCPHYSECLTREARADSPGWDCSGCAHQWNQVPHPESDLSEYWLLLWAIFDPEKFKAARLAMAGRDEGGRSG